MEGLVGKTPRYAELYARARSSGSADLQKANSL
jgi:hypothetical protein